MGSSRPGLRPSGFGLALLAFALTRFLVVETAQADVGAFVGTSILPLSAGLGLTVFGVALGVGAVSRAYARTVWRWAVLGTFAMLVVFVTTALHVVLLGDRLDTLWDQSGVFVANVLLAGAILGTIAGDRSAKSRRTNERLVQYAERTMLVNRLLRHEILNAVAIVRGYAATEGEDREEAVQAIRESTEQIERTVEHVGEFAATTGEVTAVDVGTVVESVLAELPDDVDVSVVGSIPDDALVRADERLGLLVAELLENAIEHGGTDANVSLEVVPRPRSVDVTVRDDGPGLPGTATDVLAARSLPEYDDPSLGYGLQMVRLLVEQYEGSIETSTDDGTTVTVTLQRTRERSTPRLALGVPTEDLYRATAASIVAGVAMGVLMAQLAGVMPVIGSLYGVENRAVGWVTHLFHSVVFGLLFAAGCALPALDGVRSSPGGTPALGVTWGFVLWLVAAGVVMPVWLLAVGVDATVPNLSPLGLLTHVVWGAVLGALYDALSGSALRELVPLAGEGSSG